MSRTTRNRRRRHARGRKSNKGLLALVVIVVLLALAGLSAVGYVVSIAASSPPLSSLKARDPGSFTVVFARDGQRLGVIQNDELRRPVSGDKFPKVLRDAVVAIEDERFYQHRGIDYLGVIRAAVKNLTTGETVQGGSTITMQLIRALYIDNERTYERKIREAKLAEELENEHPGREGKDWILETYLNTVPFGTVGGQSALGAWAAAKMYFNKPVEKLELHEAALLAGIPQATDTYSPVRNPEAAKNRRNEVLRRMLANDMITPQEYADASAMELGLDPSNYFQARREKFFFDYVKDELFDAFGAAEVRKGGMRVYTTIDLKLQRAARTAINGRLAGIGPSAAVVTVDPKNGEILAMASSSDYAQSKFNLAAQGKRQPGSAFKTMALVTALRRGIDPDSTYYVSKPLKFKDPSWGPIEVKTYDNTYGGSMNLTRATLKSDNSVYTQLALDLGPGEVKQTAQDMGITTKLDGYPAETLGGLTIGVSPLEMANAYATLTSGGHRHKPIAITRIRTREGEVLKGEDLPERLQPKKVKAFPDGVTYEAVKILEQNIKGGTGGKAAIGCPAGGKTGTTDKHSDAWFVGFTPRLATAVWVGYPKAQIFMRSEYHGGVVAGGTFPAEIWGDYMKKAKGGFCGDWPKPKEPITFTKFFGKYATGKADTGDVPYSTATPGPGGAEAPSSNGKKKKKAEPEDFDPTLYEAPPQPEPTAAPPQAAPPANDQGGAGAPAPQPTP